jgi:hypothetical protein
VTGYHQNANLIISQKARLSSVKLNHIGVDGRYTETATNEVILADLPGNGPLNPVHPNQIALAISLTTGYSRGPAHRGRFYLPLPSYSLTPEGSIAPANAELAAQETQTFIDGLNAVNEGWQVAVFSRKLGAPAIRPVTGVEVGRVYDTQRRRRRSLIEDYQS